MSIKKTVIKGLAFNVVVVEDERVDTKGGLLCYLAFIYVVKKGSKKKLVHRSRLTGTANYIENEIKKNGLRALDKFGAL